MKRELTKIANIIFGKNTGDDWVSFKIALADNIVGSLKDVEFLRANRLIIGCENTHYRDAVEDAGKEIIKAFMNQGGTLKELAQRIGRANGIVIKEGPAPKGAEVRTIPSDSLPVSVWFYLEYEENLKQKLLVFWKDGTGKEKSVELKPVANKRIILGRGTGLEDENMIGFPDFKKTTSRTQVALYFEKGLWYCMPIKKECPTFVDGRYVEVDNPVELGQQDKNGQIWFGRSTSRDILRYYLIDDNSEDSETAVSKIGKNVL